MPRVFRDETPALEQGDLTVERALREPGDGLQVLDRQGLAMTGERREHEQHTFRTGDILLRVHGDHTTSNDALRMPERSQFSKIDFPFDGNMSEGFSPKKPEMLCEGRKTNPHNASTLTPTSTRCAPPPRIIPRNNDTSL